MERPGPRVALDGGGERAVPMQVLVPVPVLPGRGSARRPTRAAFVPVLVFLLARQVMRQQRGIQRLVVRPPQLHVVLILQARFALHVDEVEDAAVFLVPAPFQRPVQDLQRVLQQLRPVALPRFLHDEPGRLDRMPRIDAAALGAVQPLAVRPDGLEAAPSRPGCMKWSNTSWMDCSITSS